MKGSHWMQGSLFIVMIVDVLGVLFPEHVDIDRSPFATCVAVTVSGCAVCEAIENLINTVRSNQRGRERQGNGH